MYNMNINRYIDIMIIIRITIIIVTFKNESRAGGARCGPALFCSRDTSAGRPPRICSALASWVPSFVGT